MENNMNLIMKDHADKAWLLGRSTDKNSDFKGKLATAVLLGLLVIILALEYSAEAAAQEDLMISHDMQSYIENYGVTVDEYGVE